MVNTISVPINEYNINQHSNHQSVNPSTSRHQKLILSPSQPLQATSTSIATKLSSNQVNYNPNHKVS